jgi:hypothetical protein
MTKRRNQVSARDAPSRQNRHYCAQFAKWKKRQTRYGHQRPQKSASPPERRRPEEAVPAAEQRWAQGKMKPRAEAA